MTTILTGTGLANDIATVRSTSTDLAAFRSAVRRIGLHLAVEVSRHLPAAVGTVTTPLAETSATRIAGTVVLLPVLRAGLGLLDAFLEVIPTASVGFAGLRRNEEDLVPVEYYRRLPDSDASTTFIVIDPMLATGGSLDATIGMLAGLPHHKIMAACLIAAPEGIGMIESRHPDVGLFVATVDHHLNEHGFIVPGLGDAGDRLFGTR